MKGIASLLVVALCPLMAGDPANAIRKGSKIYIEKMQYDLDGYIVAEMMQKKLPLEVVSEPDQADYIMIGNGTDEQNRKWHAGWLTAEQDRTTGNIRIVHRATKRLVFAAEAGDRSLLWGAMARGGQRKVASRLVSKVKKSIR